MALTKEQWKQKLHEGKRSAPSPPFAAAAPQRMESIVGPRRMGRRQSAIERLQTRSVPPGLDGGGGGAALSGVDAAVGSSTCQLCGPGSLCGPGCVGRSMPAGGLPSPGTAPPKQRMGRRQSVIECLQGPPTPDMPAEVGMGSALSGVNAGVASLPQSVCQLCGPGSVCGPGCVGRSAPAGAIPTAGGNAVGARRGGGGRRASVADRLSLLPDGGPGQPDRLQIFSSNRTNKTVSLAIAGGDGSGMRSKGTDTGDEFDTPGSTLIPIMQMDRWAPEAVQEDGAKVIVPLGGQPGGSSQNLNAKRFSFGKDPAVIKSRDTTLGSVAEAPHASRAGAIFRCFSLFFRLFSLYFSLVFTVFD